ncbi:terminase [Vibrio phage 2.058.O._10N.286.46.B8]|nr:terminase [Vibrio phage 2.058.O._10N.286.46.B8]
MSYNQKISKLGLDVEELNWRKHSPDLVDYLGTSIHDTYFQGWQSADQYAYDVRVGNIKAGKEVRNSIDRYIVDRFTREDLDWCTEEIDMMIIFSNSLKHSKGKLMGKSLLLMPWMIFTFANVYGWYVNSGDREGERRFSKAFLMVARGNAKSMLCSIQSLWNMEISPNGEPASFCVARNEDQAGIVFRDAKAMLKRGDTHLKRRFRVMGKEIIGLGKNEGFFRALPNDPEAVDGKRVAFGICDELHAHHSSTLSNTLINGAGATVDSIIFFISTAGINLDGPCVNERNLVRDINANLVPSDSYFGIEYAIDINDGDSWEDEEVWIKANPALGHAVRINHLRSELVRAKQTATNRRDFLTKYCNIFVNTNDSPYMDLLELQVKCADDSLDFSEFIDKECALGLDLAQTFDLAALSFIFPTSNGGVSIFQKHYFPAGQFKSLPPQKQEMYTQWEEDGHLTFTDSSSTDFEYIKDDIRWAHKMFDVESVGYDPYAGTQLAISMEKEGINMQEVRQGFLSMSEPAKLFQKLVAEGLVRYQESDKCFEWCVANSVCSADKNENIKVHKSSDKPHDKVDSVVALITGLALAKVKEATKEKNPYQKRGMIMI